VSFRWITRNLGWKLGALALSAVLWFAIIGEPELVTTRAIPILYKNLPSDLLIGPDALEVVRVELRGSAGRLTGANLSDLAVLLDLGGVGGPGERTFTLSDADLRLPDGVTFLHAVPSQLRLRISRRKSKEVPVAVRFVSSLPPGYQIAKQEVFPEKVEISGPEARVNAISSAETDAIDLSGMQESQEMRVNTFIADPQVWLDSPPMVRVKLTLEKRAIP
jgi:YbbR domain-containing protein